MNDDTEDIDDETDNDIYDETDIDDETETAPSSSLWYHSTMNTETGAFKGRGDRCRVR